MNTNTYTKFEEITNTFNIQLYRESDIQRMQSIRLLNGGNPKGLEKVQYKKTEQQKKKLIDSTAETIKQYKVSSIRQIAAMLRVMIFLVSTRSRR